MLKRLHISNYALIEELEVTFPGNLTVITGETGAGKSIFLEALGLALGNRADISSLQDKNKKCVVEAVFDISKYNIKGFFKDHDLDFDTTLILRREITSDGKSRSFINDTPANLSLLKELSESLIDVHSQHQNLFLNQSKFQLQLIDAFAGSGPDFEVYQEHYFTLNKKLKELELLNENEKQAKKDLDYFKFLFEELNEYDLSANDVTLLEEESKTLENAEQIKGTLNKLAYLIDSGEQGAIQVLAQIKQQLNGIAKYNSSFTGLLERVNSVLAELKDIHSEVENEEGKMVFNPNKLNEINDKLDKINRLFKKHSVKSVEELLEIKSEIELKLQKFGSLEDDIKRIQKEVEQLKKNCLIKAKEISAKRIKALSGIEDQINTLLSVLAMPNAQFKIELNTQSEIGSSGIDKISFLFSANKGGDFKELQKVASGGETSRLMLSIKSVLAQKRSLPSIIFDEIDTGISGDVADKMGQIFLQMAKNMQVISITHLPQIASKGKHHLFVFKNDSKSKTTSYIKSLEGEERIVEIAKMLSTGKPTESAIKNAQDLLSAN